MSAIATPPPAELVPLHRDPISSGSHVKALPRWIPPMPSAYRPQGRATYWHQPRSAYLKSDGIMVVSLWCGPSRFVDPALLVAVEPDCEFKCGTCVGRRLGYERAHGLIFQPVDHWALPKRCPSTSPDPDDWRLCLACGRKTNAARAPFGWGLAQHRPDPDLAVRFQPCYLHGWERMGLEFDHAARRETGRLRCSAHACSHVTDRKAPTC